MTHARSRPLSPTAAAALRDVMDKENRFHPAWVSQLTSTIGKFFSNGLGLE